MAASLSKAGLLIGLLLLSPGSLFVSAAVFGFVLRVPHLGMPFTSHPWLGIAVEGGVNCYAAWHQYP